jgi:hypothetical protein
MKKVTLVSAKGIKGGKVQLTFSQIVETGKTPTGLLGILNASDERFNQSKPRYSWLSAQPSDVQLQFGIDTTFLAEGEELEINMIDPKITGDDRSLNLQITETVKGSDYDVANFETRAKRAGKDGDFIMSNGMYIYVNTAVVIGEPKHVLLTDTTRLALNTDASSAIADALGA